MEEKKVLFIGSGQAGCRVVNEFFTTYELPNCKKIMFNTAQDNDIENITLLKGKTGFEGSGKNPLNTFESIIPNNVDMLKDSLYMSLKGVETVVLVNSLGGGSGSAINYHLITEILIPYKEEIRNVKIISAVILPFKSEGNPCNSNALAMLNNYYKLTKYITLIPIDNNFIVQNQAEATVKNINELISEILLGLIDYKSFVGQPKDNGLGTLDENEFNRIMSPHNGFLLYNEVLAESLLRSCDEENFEYFRDNFFNNFDMTTASSLLFLFRTADEKNIPISYLDRINKMFSNQIKIFAECHSKIDDGMVAIVANGVALPKSYTENAEKVINSINSRKENIKFKNKINKETLKIGKKSLFKI